MFSVFWIDDPKMQCKVVLELSYMHLPDYLKSCFLYFGMFLEHKDIPLWKLIWLRISDIFVKEMGHKSLGNLAKEYLMNLIGQSVVIIRYFSKFDHLHVGCRLRTQHRIRHILNLESQTSL